MNKNWKYSLIRQIIVALISLLSVVSLRSMATKTSDLKSLTVAQLRAMAKKKSISLTGVTKKADIIAVLSKSTTPVKKTTKKVVKKTTKGKLGWSFDVRKGDDATILMYHGPSNLELTFLTLSLTEIVITLRENQKDIHSVSFHSRGQGLFFTNDEGQLEIATQGSKVQISTFATVKYDKSFHTVIDKLSAEKMRDGTANVTMTVL